MMTLDRLQHQLIEFLRDHFKRPEEHLHSFIQQSFGEAGENLLAWMKDHGEYEHGKYLDELVVAMKRRGMLDPTGRTALIGYLTQACPEVPRERIVELGKSLTEIARTLPLNELDREPTTPVTPLSYGAAAGEFRLFAKTGFPPKDILAPQDGVGEPLPALEFVKPRATFSEASHPLRPEFRHEVLIHTIHAGRIIPRSLIEVPKVEEWFRREDQRRNFLEEKDWGANQMAQAIVDELGLSGYLRVNIARSVLDFGRFPGVSPPGADHLNRLAVSAELGEQIGREKVDELLNLYHEISAGFERAVWTTAKSKDIWARSRPRQIILGIHTYDKYNREGTLRPPISLISRSRTYDLNRTMHPGPFDRLYPDELAEFTADRCLVAAIAHTLERERIEVADNHPYSMPDGCVEIRSQVWYFFKSLQHLFKEEQAAIVNNASNGLLHSDFERVWDMLLDTTLRHTESASLRSYIHRHRISINNDRRNEYLRYRKAYEEITKFRNRPTPSKHGRAAAIDRYRLSPERPSSLGLEVRKDLIWEYDDPQDNLDPRRAGWKTPVQEDRAVIEPNVRRIAKLIARGIKEYLEKDRPSKSKAEELFNPYG